LRFPLRELTTSPAPYGAGIKKPPARAAKELKMKYDIYKGTRADFENSGGELIKGKVTKQWLRGFLVSREFKTADIKKAFDGEIVNYKDGVLWVEEAM
jgi:hypothetical protein